MEKSLHFSLAILVSVRHFIYRTFEDSASTQHLSRCIDVIDSGLYFPRSFYQHTKQWIQQIINPPNYPWYIGLILHHYFGTAEYTKHWHLINLYALQIINYIEIYAKSSEIFNRCKWYPIGFVYFGYFQNTVLSVFIPSKLASYMMMAIYQEISWKSRCSSFDFLRPLYTATANDKKNYR